MAEFHTRTKKSEGWVNFGDDLRVLADQAFPTLGMDPRQLLALQQYLTQLDNPQVAFAVKQRHTTTVEAVVSITLESYLLQKQRVALVEEAPVDHLEIKQDALLETTSPKPKRHLPPSLATSAARGTLRSRMCSQNKVARKRQSLSVVVLTSEGELEAPEQCSPPTTVYSTVSELS